MVNIKDNLLVQLFSLKLIYSILSYKTRRYYFFVGYSTAGIVTKYYVPGAGIIINAGVIRGMALYEEAW